MTYDGHVEPGGDPAARELDALTVTKVSVGPMDNNAYLLESRSTGDLLLVDAANDADRLLALVAGRPLGAVVTTHRHFDHWQGLQEVVTATGARTYAGADDAEGIPVPTDQTLTDGDTVAVGDCTLRVVALVGHTPGSIALVYDDPAGHPHLFTGDSLFPGGPGKTANPKDFSTLMDDLEARIFGVLDDATWFYPGHGDDSTLGAQRPSLPEWRSRGW
jgi:glyoxylase-like metal-dependent hydrolase (beta-lactamase superfamily II)